MRRGITLIEVLIASAIMALAVVPILTVLSNAGEGLKQTQPYTQAVFLAEKAMEHARLGSNEDPYYVERMAGDALASSRLTVLRGNHAFLAAIEDSAAPLGRIEPGIDWAIQPEIGPLYNLVEPLALQVETAVAPGRRGRNEATVTVGLDWLDLRGRAMSYWQATPVMMWQPLARIETPLPPTDDAALGKALAPTAGQGLAALAAARGARPEALGALASVALLGAFGVAATRAADEPVRAATTRVETAATKPARGRELNRRARLREALAAQLFPLLAAMKPALTTLADPLPAGALGTPMPTLEARVAVLDAVKVTLEGALFAARGALQDSAEAAGLLEISASERLMAHQRLARIAKLEAIALPWPSRAPLVAFLRSLADFYRGRMPNVQHSLQVEADRVPEMETRYPLFLMAKDVNAVRQALPRASIRLLVYPSQLSGEVSP